MSYTTTRTTTTTFTTTYTTTTTTTYTNTAAAINITVFTTHTSPASTNTTTTTTATMPYITLSQESPRSRGAPYSSRASFTNFGLTQIRTACPTAHEDSCSICLEAYSDIDPGTKITICRHIFHRPCLMTWLESSSTCPMCRADLFASATSPYWLHHPLPSASVDRLDTTSESTNPRRNLFERRGGVWGVPALPLPHARTDTELSMMVGSEERDGPDALDALATWRMAASEEAREGREQGETPLDY